MLYVILFNTIKYFWVCACAHIFFPPAAIVKQCWGVLFSSFLATNFLLYHLSHNNSPGSPIIFFSSSVVYFGPFELCMWTLEFRNLTSNKLADCHSELLLYPRPAKRNLAVSFHGAQWDFNEKAQFKCLHPWKRFVILGSWPQNLLLV